MKLLVSLSQFEPSEDRFPKGVQPITVVFEATNPINGKPTMFTRRVKAVSEVEALNHAIHDAAMHVLGLKPNRTLTATQAERLHNVRSQLYKHHVLHTMIDGHEDIWKGPSAFKTQKRKRK